MSVYNSLIDQVMSNSLGFEEIELAKSKKSKYQCFLGNRLVNDFKIALHPTIDIKTNFNSEDTKLTLDRFHLTTAIIECFRQCCKIWKYNYTIIS